MRSDSTGVPKTMDITRADILNWLRETDPLKLETLWQAADETRRDHVGQAVHLRGLLEISNICVRSCAYCGIRSARTGLERYRMTAAEIVDTARRIANHNLGTVVLQAGEDPGITRQWLSTIIKRIKTETGLAITLSLGERSDTDLAAWRQAGADRYLLRFETSDRALYNRIHPPRPGQTYDRFDTLRWLAGLGYEVGTGVMVGIPGQTLASLADDIEIFRELDVDMIGLGPFLPHPDTPLGSLPPMGPEQVPNDEMMTLKMLALTRLVCPNCNIPSTTALSTLSTTSREQGLKAGANVIMPNFTPEKFRLLYEIYPSKARVDVNNEQFPELIKNRITALGRTVGQGPGRRPDQSH